jgi:ATP-dependent Clp protease adaptor protein ClpS
VPRLYRVLLHNDDYTPRHFVVAVLKEIFAMDDAAANAVMLTAHTKGLAACGVFPKDIAETKVKAAHDYVKQYELPLRFSTEPA